MLRLSVMGKNINRFECGGKKQDVCNERSAALAYKRRQALTRPACTIIAWSVL